MTLTSQNMPDEHHSIVQLDRYTRHDGDVTSTKRGHFSEDPRTRHLDVQWFQGGLVFQAHRAVYHSTLGSRAIKKKKTV